MSSLHTVLLEFDVSRQIERQYNARVDLCMARQDTAELQASASTGWGCDLEQSIFSSYCLFLYRKVMYIL